MRWRLDCEPTALLYLWLLLLTTLTSSNAFPSPIPAPLPIPYPMPLPHADPNPNPQTHTFKPFVPFHASSQSASSSRSYTNGYSYRPPRSQSERGPQSAPAPISESAPAPAAMTWRGRPVTILHRPPMGSSEVGPSTSSVSNHVTSSNQQSPPNSNSNSTSDGKQNDDKKGDGDGEGGGGGNKDAKCTQDIWIKCFASLGTTTGNCGEALFEYSFLKKWKNIKCALASLNTMVNTPSSCSQCITDKIKEGFDKSGKVLGL